MLPVASLTAHGSIGTDTEPPLLIHRASKARRAATPGGLLISAMRRTAFSPTDAALASDRRSLRPRPADRAICKRSGAYRLARPAAKFGSGIHAAHVRYGYLRFGKRPTDSGEKPDDRWTVRSGLRSTSATGPASTPRANGRERIAAASIRSASPVLFLTALPPVRHRPRPRRP